MNNKNIIKPSAETLVVGARVKLRNGREATVTSIADKHAFSVRCNIIETYTKDGSWLARGRQDALDIVEVIAQESRNTIDVSTFKAGDTIKFNDGGTAELSSIEKEKDGYRKLHIMSSEGDSGVWAFKNDGTPRGFSTKSTHAIIEHLAKTPEATEAPISATNAVAHPSHYTSHPSGIECIQVTQHMNFNLGNVVKYVWRNGLKDSDNNIQDLKKAQWYLNNEIERLEKQ